MLLLLCSAMFVVLVLSYVYLTMNYDYWMKRNVPFTKPLLFFGNMKDALVGNKHLGAVFTDIYREHPTATWVGYWKLRTPAVMIRDLDLVRKVLISEYSSYAANEFKRDKKIDPIRGYNPFPSNGQEWKLSRSHVIANVTTSKVKVYFESMLNVGQRTINFLNKGVKDGGDNYVEHDTRLIGIKKSLHSSWHQLYHTIWKKCQNPQSLNATTSIMQKASQRMSTVEFLASKPASFPEPFVTCFIDYAKAIDFKLAGRYTIDVIAMAVFGVENNSFQCYDNIFTQIGNNIFFNTLFNNIKLLMMSFWPALSKLLRSKFLNDATEKKLLALISSIMKKRAEENIARNDFLQQMLKYRQNDTKNFVTDMYITSHAYGFIADGFETSNQVIGYALYELAWNPHVQDKLRQEISEVFKRAGVLRYEDLQDMQYLKMVINETLRRHPPAFSLTKETTRRVELPPPTPESTEPVVLWPGTAVTIPVQAIHMDPEVYPDPEIFEPERFTPIATESRHEMALLGLGAGPRSCPGYRYGLTQAKTLLFTVLREFEVRPSPRTPEYPTHYDPCTIVTRPAHGAYIKFIPLPK